jgi:hypothetical protein
MNSKFLKLNATDFIKGLVLAAITALITGTYELIQSGWALTFDWITWKPIIMTTAAAALSYLIKNFFTNSSGNVLTAERK